MKETAVPDEKAGRRFTGKLGEKSARRFWAAGLSLCMMGLLIAGCSGGTKNTEPPEDTPWNHGHNAIMETDDGYYFNRSENSFNYYREYEGQGEYVGVGQYLKYWEKETGTSILLCNKPECQHQGGDDCEATYRSIRTVNTMLYDGSLYILGMEYVGDLVSINLYRGALDGSAIDKVGTIIEAENLKGENISDPSTKDGFIIHKGYAYIPYYLRFGQASRTFMGGGLAKMDIKTGEVKTIFETKTVSADFPELDGAAGDYVYFRGTRNYKGYRYVISEDRVEETTAFTYIDKDLYEQMQGDKKKKQESEEDDAPEGMKKMVYPVTYIAFSKDLNYSAANVWSEESEDFNDSVLLIQSFDAVTGEQYDSFYADIRTNVYDDVNLVCYEDKLMLTVGDTAYWYSRQGEKLAQVQAPVPKKGYGYEREEFSFKINNGKLYLINRDTMEYSWPVNYTVYSWPLAELFEGKGGWTEAYKINNITEWPGLEESEGEDAGN